MKVKVDRNGKIVEAKSVRIETEDFIYLIDICPVTKNLQINKIDGIESSPIVIFPRVSNEIEIK